MRGAIVKRGNEYTVVISLGRDPKTGRSRQKWHSGYQTKKEAEKARVELLHSLGSGVYVEPSKLTVADFLLRWLDNYARPNVSPKTFQRYEEIVKGRLIRDLYSVPLRKLTPKPHPRRLRSLG